MKRLAQRGGRIYLRAARGADREEVLRLNRASLRFHRGVVMPPVTARGVFRSGYLGYQTGAPHARAGYMTEALALMLRQAFGPLRLHRVEANIQPGNRASIALARRAGFRLEGLSRRYLKIGGRWRDHERWALTVEEWRRRRRRQRGKSGGRSSA